MRMLMLARLVSLMSIGAAYAQSPGSPPAAGESPSAAGAVSPSPAIGRKAVRAASRNSASAKCRRDAKQKGLRGDAATSAVAVCIAEARLNCTKQAAAQNLGKREFRAFVRQCLGQRERKRKAK